MRLLAAVLMILAGGMSDQGSIGRIVVTAEGFKNTEGKAFFITSG
jgi:hypothetical protein